MNSTTLVLFVGFLAYAALGGVALRLWRRRIRQLHPTNQDANPVTELAYQLPLIVFVQVWALIGGGPFAYLFINTTPLFKGTQGASLMLVAAGLTWIGFAVLFAAIDTVLLVRVLRQAGAYQNDPT